MSLNKIVFTGQMGSGKDYVADRLNGYYKMGFSDPMLKIGAAFFGKLADKSNVQYREFLQNIAEWGWGRVGDECPLSALRGVVSRDIRRHGAEMAGGEFHMVNWKEYGERQDFWPNIIVQRTKYLTDRWELGTPPRFVVTGARHPHDIAGLLPAGYEHFHVMCSEFSRRQRLGSGYCPEKDAHQSEMWARRLNDSALSERVVWNDDLPPYPDRLYAHSVTGFVSMVKWDWSAGIEYSEGVAIPPANAFPGETRYIHMTPPAPVVNPSHGVVTYGSLNNY